MGRGRHGNSREQPEACRIVQRVHAQPMRLRDAISYLAQGVEGVQQMLVKPGDTQAYTDTLLCKTLVAFESTPPAKQQGWRLSQRFSQEQVGIKKHFELLDATAELHDIEQQSLPAHTSHQHSSHYPPIVSERQFVSARFPLFFLQGL